jgi:hypothetical protein
MNFTLKVFKNNKLVSKCQTHSTRRFLKKLRTINWKNFSPRVYLKVSYGKLLDNFGKLTNFVNEGEYTNKKDLWQAFEAFTEKEDENVTS